MNAEIYIVELGRPATANDFMRWHWHQRAEHTREWRLAAKVLWRLALGPPPTRSVTEAVIIATPLVSNWRGLPDAAACYPAAKAAIDGTVDAGLLIDDSPEHVRRIIFEGPEFYHKNGLRLKVEGEYV